MQLLPVLYPNYAHSHKQFGEQAIRLVAKLPAINSVLMDILEYQSLKTLLSIFTFYHSCHFLPNPPTMASNFVAEISRSDLKDLKTPPTAFITDVKHLASYNWLEKSTPTIAVPGLPARWSPLRGPQRLNKDTGLVYIAQNAARHPDSPLEPLFRAILFTDPSFDLRSTDVVTDRNNLRKLLSFVNPGLDRKDGQGFTINVEMVTDTTAMFCREETATQEYIAPHEFRGFGHEFEKKYTATALEGSTGHHRIISYRFGDLQFIVRHETDGYVGDIETSVSISSQQEPEDGDALSGLLGSLSLAPSRAPATKLTVRGGGQMVPRESTLEIKTRIAHRPLAMSEVAPQLWASQTPKLVRAYHSKGIFQEPRVEDVTAQIKRWEQERQDDLRTLAALVRKLLDVVARECKGPATVTYDAGRDRLVVRKLGGGKKMLPEDLYSKWKTTASSDEGTEDSAKHTGHNGGTASISSGNKPASHTEVPSPSTK